MSTFTHKGVSITVTRSGKFTAQIDDLEITADTLVAAQQKIEAATREVKEKKPIALKVVGVIMKDRDRTDTIVHAATFTGFNRSTRKFQFASGDIPKGYEFDSDSILADTPENRKALEIQLEARKPADAADGRVRKAAIKSIGYGRIDSIEQYERMIEAIKAEHAKSAKVK